MSDLNTLAETALDLYREGRLRQARRACESILKQEQRPVALQILAKIAHRQNKLGEAAEHYEQYLRMFPNDAEAHYRLGIVFKESGRSERAIECFSLASGFGLADDALDRHLGDAYSRLGRWDLAIGAYMAYLESSPGDSAAHCALGLALRELGRLIAAKACFENAVRTDASNIHALVELSRTELLLGNAEGAVSLLKQAADHESDSEQISLGLAMALRQNGDISSAVSVLEKLLEANPVYGEAHHQLARLDPDSHRVTAVRAALGEQKISKQDATMCHFALGHLLDHDEAFDEAFEQFRLANNAYRERHNYDPSLFDEAVSKQISAFSKDYFATRSGIGSDSELPLFIVGLPRSGTSLVEQILASHPRVHGAGELNAIGGIVQVLTGESEVAYPDCVAGLGEADVAGYADSYLEELRRHDAEALRITDKLPANYLALGLIKTLFPRARIIHCQRDPGDHCLSLYSNCLPLMKSSFDLAELGHHYLGYQRLMAHWNDVFGDDLFNLQYEDLVGDQESLSRQIINYAGLDWDEACLSFWRADRSVATPSNLQVRQPIYSESVGRWQRYETHLQPFFDVLGSVAT